MQNLMRTLSLCALMIANLSALAQLPDLKRNIFKLNLTSIVFKNASVQYEHLLNKKMSVALGTSYMPKTDLPFASALQEQWGTNPDAKRAIETTQLSSFTVTPEVRFYLAGNAPNGFYIAPFARYQNMEFEQVYQYTASNGKVHSPLIGGKINNIGGGVLLGAQWSLGKSLVFDWWIAGPLVGSSNGTLTGFDDMSDLSSADRTKLEKDIEDTKLPLLKTDAVIGTNRIDVNLSGGYAGLRAFGFAFGYRF